MLARLKAWFCGDNILNLEWTQTFFFFSRGKKNKRVTLWSAAKSSAWSDEFQDASVASIFERVPNGANTRRILSKLQILKRTTSSTGAVRLSSSRNALFIGGVYDKKFEYVQFKGPFPSPDSHLHAEPSEMEFVSYLFKARWFCFCFIIVFMLKRVGCSTTLRRSESSKTDLEIEWWMELELAWTMFNSTKSERNNTPSCEKLKAKRVMS